MKTLEEINSGLAQCYGTLAYYTNQVLRFVYTDGVKFLWESCDAYWLLIAISSYQHNPKIRKISRQTWKLEVKGSKAVLTMNNGSNKFDSIRQEIPYTDFPLDEIILYLIDDGTNVVLILPTED